MYSSDIMNNIKYYDFLFKECIRQVIKLCLSGFSFFMNDNTAGGGFGDGGDRGGQGQQSQNGSGPNSGGGGSSSNTGAEQPGSSSSGTGQANNNDAATGQPSSSNTTTGQPSSSNSATGQPGSANTQVNGHRAHPSTEAVPTSVLDQIRYGNFRHDGQIVHLISSILARSNGDRDRLNRYVADFRRAFSYMNAAEGSSQGAQQGRIQAGNQRERYYNMLLDNALNDTLLYNPRFASQPIIDLSPMNGDSSERESDSGENE